MRNRHFMPLLILLLAVSATAPAQERILEAVGPPPPRAIIENCSDWHELYPQFCGSAHQDDWEDNGDGELSPCDFLILDGERVHVDWVGPTYWLDCGMIVEPIEPMPGNPTCQEFVEVWPSYGSVWHVDNWADNGDDEVSACDFLILYQPGQEPVECHVDEVGLNIHVSSEGTPSEDGSWSRVKQLWGLPPF